MTESRDWHMQQHHEMAKKFVDMKTYAESLEKRFGVESVG